MSTAALQSFERFTVRYRIRAELVALEGLRIGGGKSLDAAATRLPVLRDARGLPYVPGSSLKGLLRSALESILRGLPERNLRLDTCNPFQDNSNEKSGSTQRLVICGHEECIDLDANGQPNAEQKLSAVLQHSCSVCGLFGSAHLAGRVWVHDLRLCGDGQAPTEVRDGVGIHRDLGTAVRSCKYDLETVPVGSRLQLEMLLENVDDVQLALLLDTLDALNRGRFRLGGSTSRGMGRVVLESPSLERLTRHRLKSGDGWQAIDYGEQLRVAGERLLTLTTTAQEN